MRLIVFSDLHIHAFHDFARTNKHGRNSRLENTLRVLRRIRKYAVREGITTVLFGGDLFHKKSLIPVSTYQPVVEELNLWLRNGLRLVGVVGNHDQATLDGALHSTKALDRRGTGIVFFDEPSLHVLDGKTRVWCVPYMESAVAFKEALLKGPWTQPGTILLAHGGINGAVTGPVEHQPKEQLSADDVPSDYAYRLFGHYHKRQKLGERLWYIGSPLQMTRGERSDGDKGFLVLDTETWKTKLIPLGFPKFVSLTLTGKPLTSKEEEAVRGNYVDVTFPVATMDADAATRIVEAAGADAVNAIPMREPAAESQQRLAVDLKMDAATMVEKYVSEYAEEDDADAILKEAKEILGRVG